MQTAAVGDADEGHWLLAVRGAMRGRWAPGKPAAVAWRRQAGAHAGVTVSFIRVMVTKKRGKGGRSHLLLRWRMGGAAQHHGSRAWQQVAAMRWRWLTHSN